MLKFKRVFLITLCFIIVVGMTLFIPATTCHAFSSSDFLKTDGTVIKNNSGTGSIVTLRGTNLGGWLTQECWMSPIGWFAVPRTGWSVSASVNSSTAGNAVDGDATTSWTTGTAQVSGQWYLINMGRQQTFNRIYVDAGSNTGDYPAGYQVLVSNDQTNWTDVASDAGTAQNTVIRFAPQVAQYVKIVQTGSKSNYWSISEVNVFSDAVYDRSGWTASASSTESGGSAQNAIDGNQSTRWSTGAAQTSGQWYEVDMGQALNISALLIDTGASSTSDYPRGYQIQVSWNGTNWTTDSIGDFGNSRTIYKEFQGQTVRYLRIMQTGSSTSWWSIDELVIYSQGDYSRHGWSASASDTDSYGDVPANALDGNTSTRWSSGLAQANGQWFQVDMGANQTFNQIVLDSGPNSQGDYPHGYTVQVSYNAINWTQVASGSGGGEQLPINFNVANARYIRVTQTGSSDNWWSIAEFNIYLNLDDYSMYECLKSRFGSSTTETLLSGYKSTWLTTSDLDNIEDMGMNCVRLPISWHELLNDDGTWKSNPWTSIDWLVNQCAQRDIYVILDLHTVPGGDCPWGSSGQQGPNPNGFWTQSSYQDMANSIWAGIATHFDGNPTIAAYDLLNEPLLSYNEGSTEISIKSALYDRLYDTVRAIDSDHIIIMGAFFGFDKIASPSTYGWTNIMYEVHPYNMNYPLIDSQQQNTISSALASMAEYQQSWNVPVFAGEYCWYGLHDVWSNWMSGLNALNASWTNWSYKVMDVKPLEADWGYYNNNPSPLPVLNSDTSSTIASKWSQFGTSNFQTNTRLIDTVSKFTDGESWIATTPLSQSGWTATASSSNTGEPASNALDWDTDTRWSTGALQTSGQWFQVDMGSKQAFDQVSFETKSSDNWDYAREYQVKVSNDASNWTTVASGMGFGDVMVIQLTPQYARYVKIVQTGSSPSNWWSIAEFHVYSENSLSRSGWTASASNTDSLGDVASNALDGNTSTRWSSGVAQANGQWYKIDMGSNQTFNRILMDSAQWTSDYAQGYQIQVSTDNTNWTTVATGTGSSSAIIVQFPVQYARYLKIVQTGSSANWWSIAELNVYGEVPYSRSGWSAYASQTESGGSAANALDGNISTRWSSGVTQSSGQWYMVDMGSSIWLNHIIMDSGSNTGDYARKYIVELSNDNTNWTQVATDEGTGQVVTVNFPICQYRYIKVTLKGSTGNWWSISEFNVYQ